MLPVRLLHLFGDVWINSYGLFLAVGAVCALLLILNQASEYFPSISRAAIYDIVLITVFSGILGGRLLYLFEQWAGGHLSAEDAFSALKFLHVGGYSVLGSFIAGFIGLVVYQQYSRNIGLLEIFDLASIMLPVVHAWGRIGCLFAGCCSGYPLVSPMWSITYTDPAALAPLNIPLIPLQFYVALGWAAIFLVGWALRRFMWKHVGIASMWYVFFAAFMRIIQDPFRLERSELFTFYSIELSFQQLLALATGLLLFVGIWALRHSAVNRRDNDIV